MIYDYNQIYQLPIMDVIRKRISVRTYQSKEIPTDLKEQLLTYGARINGPFQPKVRLEFIDNASIAVSYTHLMGKPLFLEGIG